MGRNAKPKSNERLEDIEAWWALIVRILSFVLGAAILASQAFLAETDRLWITLAGIGLCGPTVAISVATMLEALRGGGASPDPEQETQ